MAIEVRFSVPVADVPEEHHHNAQQDAFEAYVMSLLRQGDISQGRAASLLGVGRGTLADLMFSHEVSPFPEMTPEELDREARAAEQPITRQP